MIASTFPVRRQRGFTLIEVLIAMVIIAILAAVAIPNYTEYVQRGRRQEAKAALLQLAQWQERLRTQTNSYATTTAALPPNLRTVTVNGGTVYNITINEGVGGATATAYTLTATRAGAMANDACGDFTLTSLNDRGLANTTRTVDQCWGR